MQNPLEKTTQVGAEIELNKFSQLLTHKQTPCASNKHFVSATPALASSHLHKLVQSHSKTLQAPKLHANETQLKQRLGMSHKLTNGCLVLQVKIIKCNSSPTTSTPSRSCATPLQRPPKKYVANNLDAIQVGAKFTQSEMLLTHSQSKSSIEPPKWCNTSTTKDHPPLQTPSSSTLQVVGP